jgi:hypothetical protein
MIGRKSMLILGAPQNTKISEANSFHEQWRPMSTTALHGGTFRTVVLRQRRFFRPESDRKMDEPLMQIGPYPCEPCALRALLGVY